MTSIFDGPQYVDPDRDARTVSHLLYLLERFGELRITRTVNIDGHRLRVVVGCDREIIPGVGPGVLGADLPAGGDDKNCPADHARTALHMAFDRLEARAQRGPRT